MLIRRKTIATIVLVFGVLLCARPGVSEEKTGKQQQKYKVKIQDFSFQPAILRVTVGSLVTWTNKDEEPHTVFSSDNAFKSRALDTGETFSFRFEKAGMYKYFCSVHPKMVGTVYVGAK